MNISRFRRTVCFFVRAEPFQIPRAPVYVRIVDLSLLVFRHITSTGLTHDRPAGILWSFNTFFGQHIL